MHHFVRFYANSRRPVVVYYPAMKFLVGYQPDAAWIDEIAARRDSVGEVYFSYGAMPSGRSAVADVERQLDDLGRLADEGIALHVLFNANCYGEDALSKSFFNEVGATVERFGDSLSGVTTTSPLVAKFVKDNFPGLKTRASVNMEIGTVEGMEYLSDVFDGFYLKRELNRDLDAVKAAGRWCGENGKELFLLANSGCLNHCSSRTFHDNLVAHEAGIAKADNGYVYRGTCWKWLARPENRARWLERTNWIAPEDVVKYEGLCAAMKLATRQNAHPVRILESYATGSHVGLMQALLEPDHSVLFCRAADGGEGDDTRC